MKKFLCVLNTLLHDYVSQMEHWDMHSPAYKCVRFFLSFLFFSDLAKAASIYPLYKQNKLQPFTKISSTTQAFICSYVKRLASQKIYPIFVNFKSK